MKMPSFRLDQQRTWGDFQKEPFLSYLENTEFLLGVGQFLIYRQILQISTVVIKILAIDSNCSLSNSCLQQTTY